MGSSGRPGRQGFRGPPNEVLFNSAPIQSKAEVRNDRGLCLDLLASAALVLRPLLHPCRRQRRRLHVLPVGTSPSVAAVYPAVCAWPLRRLGPGECRPLALVGFEPCGDQAWACPPATSRGGDKRLVPGVPSVPHSSQHPPRTMPGLPSLRFVLSKRTTRHSRNTRNTIESVRIFCSSLFLVFHVSAGCTGGVRGRRPLLTAQFGLVPPQKPEQRQSLRPQGGTDGGHVATLL